MNSLQPTRLEELYYLLTETLARMQRRVQAARLMCWRAAWMADTEQPNTKEASFEVDIPANEAFTLTIYSQLETEVTVKINNI